jgi:Ion channel
LSVIIAFNWSGDVIELFLMVNLGAAALGAVSKSARNQLLALVLAAAVLRAFGRWMHVHWASKAAVLFWIVLAFVAAVNALRFALKGKRITTEHVYAALSAYLLAGHFAGFVYYVVEDMWPGSFLENGTTAIHFSIQHSIYFSFVTLSTLGYGDIVPLGPVREALLCARRSWDSFTWLYS